MAEVSNLQTRSALSSCLTSSNPFLCTVCNQEELTEDPFLHCTCCRKSFHINCEGSENPDVVPQFILSSFQWRWNCRQCVNDISAQRVSAYNGESSSLFQALDSFERKMFHRLLEMESRLMAALESHNGSCSPPTCSSLLTQAGGHFPLVSANTATSHKKNLTSRDVNFTSGTVKLPPVSANIATSATKNVSCSVNETSCTVNQSAVVNECGAAAISSTSADSISCNDEESCNNFVAVNSSSPSSTTVLSGRSTAPSSTKTYASVCSTESSTQQPSTFVRSNNYRRRTSHVNRVPAKPVPSNSFGPASLLKTIKDFAAVSLNIGLPAKNKMETSGSNSGPTNRLQSKNGFIIGEGSTSGLLKCSASRKSVLPNSFDIFVTRLDPSTSSEAVKEFIANSFHLQGSVVKLRTKFNSYSSFKVSCPGNEHILLNPSLWPKGVLLQKYRGSSSNSSLPSPSK